MNYNAIVYWYVMQTLKYIFEKCITTQGKAYNIKGNRAHEQHNPISVKNKLR